MSGGLVGVGKVAAFLVGLGLGSWLTGAVLGRLDVGWQTGNAVRMTWQGIATGGALLLTPRPLNDLLASVGLLDRVTLVVLATPAAMVVAMVGFWAVRRGLASGVVHHGPDQSAPWSYRLGIGVLFLVLAGSFYGTVLGVIPVSVLWLFPVWVGLFFLRNRLQPWLAPYLDGQFRPPTDAERRRIAECFERADSAPPDEIRVVPADIPFNDTVSRFPGTRHLLLSESTVAVCADAELAAAVIVESEKERRGFYRTAQFFLLLGPLVLSMIGVVLLEPGDASAYQTELAALIVVGTAIILNRVRHCRRVVYDADGAAGAALGDDALVDIYETAGDRLLATVNIGVVPAPVARWLNPLPTVAERIARLKTNTPPE